MHQGSAHQRADCETPHHVKMPFTIGVTPSLVKRVALKGALAHSAHVVLQQGGRGKGKREKTRGRQTWQKRGGTKAGLDLTATVEKTDGRRQSLFLRKCCSKSILGFSLSSHLNI